MTTHRPADDGALHADDGPPLDIQFFVNSVYKGGTYFRFHNLALGLVRLGHRVSVYAGDSYYWSHTRDEIRDGLPYHIIPENPLTRLFGVHSDPLTAVRRFARQYPRCDVAHLFQPFLSATSAWSRSRSRVRFYDWDDLWWEGLIQRDAHKSPKQQWEAQTIQLLEARLPAWSDRVTASSGFLADRAHERKARAVTVIHNGFWPVPYPDRSDARRQVGLRADALYAGFMGRTTDELPWCIDGLAENLGEVPTLRLAVCGAREAFLQDLPPAVRERVDYLGQLAPEQTRAFASSLDLGLLPLADNSFNQSRFPIKFSEHLASGVPLLCSTIGECGRLADTLPGVIPAGHTRANWLAAFHEAVHRIAADPASHRATPADMELLRAQMSWDLISRQLASAYRTALSESGRKSGLARGVPRTVTLA